MSSLFRRPPKKGSFYLSWLCVPGHCERHPESPRTHCVSLYTANADHAEQLQDEKDKQLNEQRARLVLGLPSRTICQPITLDAFQIRYFDYYEKSRDKSAATLYAERSHLNMLIEFFGATAPLSSLTDDRLRSYKLHRLTRGHRMPDGSRRPLSPYSWKSHLASLKSMGTIAERWRLVARNPFATVTAGPLPPLPSKAISAGQLTKVLQTTRERFWQLVILLIYGLDCRRGELCRLLRTDVHRKEGYLEILKTKEGRRKRIPLTPDLLAIIDELQAMNPHGEYVCTLKGGPMRGDQVTKAIGAIGRAAGVQLSPHRLRHTSTTELLERGASLGAVQTIAGHSQLTTTQGYIHPDLTALRRALKRLPIRKLSLVPTATVQCKHATRQKIK